MQTIQDQVSWSTEQLLQWRTQFEIDGYLHVESLFNPEEVEAIQGEFTRIHSKGVPGFYEPVTEEAAAGDPLQRYPRVMHPHRYSEVARNALVHPRVRTVLEVIFGCEPLAAQSMYYFKPPGARGQALHQDNFYLMVDPGTCVAAWTAIDDVDGENGGMYVVPKTNTMEIVCPAVADSKESFTSHLVPVPKGHKAKLVPMKAGDTLFFNGSLIHGSGPNRSKDRFRRSFICHYVAGDTRKISKFYNPLVRMNGGDQFLEENLGGGPCGSEWTGAVH